MSILRFIDSEKSINTSSDDYTTLKNYHHSFNNMTKTSQLRLAIAPGTVKYFNKEFEHQGLPFQHQGYSIEDGYGGAGGYGRDRIIDNMKNEEKHQSNDPKNYSDEWIGYGSVGVVPITTKYPTHTYKLRRSDGIKTKDNRNLSDYAIYPKLT
jgi:hypothetical protein